jgi:hypothetical protein
VGIATKVYSGPASAWVQAHLGGFLYVVFWCVVVLLVWPHISATLVSSLVFLATSGLEVLQLWHPPALDAVRGTFLGHALLGSHFAWWDFPHYAAGAVVAVGVGRLLERPSSTGETA